jgi:chemotaxis methyl-accepting protein methylase
VRPAPAGEPETEISLHARALVRGILHGTGVNPSAYRMTALARRIPACLRALGAASEDEAIRLVARDPLHRVTALNTLLLGVTEFFRDAEPYAALRRMTLPELLRNRAGLRILSAGCSDGSELYSLGMCAAEHGALARSQLHGIDCRRAAVDAAAAGWYSKDAVRTIPSDFQMRHLRWFGGGYQITQNLRSKTSWQVGDLSSFSAQARFDLIACRNVAIYLAHDAAAELWSKLHSALADGGILFVGKAERPSGSFERIVPCLYRKV